MGIITLQNDALLVEISTHGAELLRIRDAEGVERLWGGDPAFFADRAPILFPIAGGLKGDFYTFQGKTYTLEKHGFASVSEFILEAHDDTSAAYLLTGDMAKHPGYPFSYAFRVQYTLTGNTVRVAYTMENLDCKALYFSVGAHEGYACPEGIEAYEIVFDKPETLERYIVDGNLLSGEKEAVPTEDGTVLKLHAGLFDNDSLVFSDLNSRAVTLRSRLHKREVHIVFPDFDYMLIWTRPPAGYVCIEPWGNLPDMADSDHDIAKKPGMTRLEPNEQRMFLHTITIA